MNKIFCALLCLQVWILSAENYRYQLAIGAIFQDEAPYLKEWIEFHKLVGVEHFYLYNNCSTDDCQSVLQPYIDRGEVDVFDWPYQAISWNNWIYEIQPAAYTDCIHQVAGKTKWLALIDIDEFLTPISAKNIPEILKDYQEFAGVGFNWKIFGHSGLYDLPEDKLLIESLVMTAPIDRSTQLGVKSIVRPEYVLDCKHPHYVNYKEGYYHVNSNKDRRIDHNGASNVIYYDRLVVNHYWSRTGSFLYKKLKRYSLWFPEIIPEKWIDYVKEMNEVHDRSMECFVAPLRKQMGLDRAQNDLESMNLHDYLAQNGSPGETEIDERYVSAKQRKSFIEELKKFPSIQKIAEIGFNAGHTAEIFLEYVNNSHMVSFDGRSHHFTKSGAEFMKSKYHDRFQFVDGDSRFTIPDFLRTNPNEKFDLIYIDDGHLFQCCLDDIVNFKQLAHENSILWVEDYNYPEVKRAVDLAERLHIVKDVKAQSPKEASEIHIWAEARYVFQNEDD